MPKIAAAFIAMVIVIALVLGDRAENPNPAPAASKMLPPDSVLSVRPRLPAVIARPSPKLSADFRQMIDSPAYGPLFTRLRSMPDRTPEQQWMYARMLYRCGKVDFNMPSSPQRKPPIEQEARAKEVDARATFIASIPVDDPDYAKRVASYDAMQLSQNHRCDAVSGEPTIARDQWRALLESSAAAGNPRARIDLLRDDLNEKSRERARVKNYGGDFEVLTPEQIDGMKQAVASGDPYAIENGTELMSYPYPNFSLRDARGQSVDPEAFRLAGVLVSCEFGYPCEQSPRMDQACALVGHCAAATVRDYVLYYGASPYQSQLIAQYENALRDAGARNDWSGFRFVAGPVTFPGEIR